MKKILNANNIISCLTAVLALVALIVYLVNIGSVGFFQGAVVDNYVLFAILAIVFCLGVIVLSIVRPSGTVGKVLDVVIIVLKVLIPVFLFLVTVSVVGARVNGFGYIFFSNVDVQQEVATPENIASAMTAIVGIVFAGLSGLFGIVSAFFLPKQVEKAA